MQREQEQRRGDDLDAPQQDRRAPLPGAVRRGACSHYVNGERTSRRGERASCQNWTSFRGPATVGSSWKMRKALRPR